MGSEFGKDYLSGWCEVCYLEGFIFINDPKESYFAICKSCGWETSEVWCPNCRMGGEFVKNIKNRPPDWTCPNCKAKYQLPKEFYDKPINLYTKKELPPLVRESIERELQANRPSFQETIWQTIKVLFAVFTLIMLALLPMTLVFTLLPWTIPGFIATLIVFVTWWWLMGKGILAKNY